jgi:hypothetical protein
MNQSTGNLTEVKSCVHIIFIVCVLLRITSGYLVAVNTTIQQTKQYEMCHTLQNYTEIMYYY